MTGAADRDWAVLAYEPFSGDRDQDIRLLSDRMGHARKHHSCIICTMPIVPGDRIRMRTEVDRDLDMVMTFRFCGFCCEAMALAVVDEKDAGRAIEERTAFGMRVRGELPLGRPPAGEPAAGENRCTGCGTSEREIYASGFLQCFDPTAALCQSCDPRGA